MADSTTEQYKAKLDALVDQAMMLPDAARAAVLKQLQQAADQIRSEIARADPSSLSASRLRAMKAEIDRVLQQFAQAATGDVAKAQATAYGDATKSVDAVVSVGAPQLAVLPVLDPKTIAIAQGYTADLITGLASDTATKINGALQRAALGGSTMQQLVEQIGGALEGGEFSGLFSEAGARASMIANNEILRMHSLSSVARIKTLAQRQPGIQKEWVHIPIARMPRLSHIAANGQTRDPDQPFDVGGEALMYPRDPSGSAANTINCHCLVRPKVDPALLQSTDAQRALLNKLGIRITTTRS